MTVGVSEEDEEYTTRPMDWRQLKRRRGVDDTNEESTMTIEVSTEEDDHKDYYNNNRGVGRG